MISCIIVDDEQHAIDVLVHFVAQTPFLELKGTTTRPLEALQMVNAEKVDLVFLDVQMPRINGTDFLRNIRERPEVVFTTAHAGFAIEGFELNAIDYLLKPITRPRFLEAVRKVEIKLGVNRQAQPPAADAPQEESFMFVKQDSRQIKVPFAEILYLEAKRDYTLIQLIDRKILAGFNLKMLEGMLPAAQFMRIHRSYIIRLSAIDALYGNLVEIRNFQVPISLAHKDLLMQALRLS